MEAAYNFAVNHEISLEISTELSRVAEETESVIEKIYGEINSLGDAWTGTSYEVFKAKCLEYKPALDALVYQLQAFSKMYSDDAVGGGITELATNISNAYNDIP